MDINDTKCNNQHSATHINKMDRFSLLIKLYLKDRLLQQSPFRFFFTSKASAGFKLCCQSCVSVQQVRSYNSTPYGTAWLPVEQRINFKILLITYKALNGQAPTYISDLLSYYRPARLLRSSTQNLLRNPCYNLKNYGDRFFAVAAPRLWNALPMAVKSSNSVDIFKRQLKSYLFLCSYVNC